MARWQFIDNAAVRPTYSFQVNPSEEDDFGKRRNVSAKTTTGDSGFVFQQSDSGPLILRCSGTILHSEQHQEMAEWYDLCSSQTIDLIDHAGDRYEGILTSFLPQRKRTLRNPRDYTNAPLWYWTYKLEFQVIRVKVGVWA